MTANKIESLSSVSRDTSECHSPLFKTVKKKKKSRNKIKALPLLMGAFWVLHGCGTKSDISIWFLGLFTRVI